MNIGYCTIGGVTLLIWKEKTYTFTDKEKFHSFMEENNLY